MSDGYDGREIVCRAYRNTDQSVNTNASSVKVQFSHVEIDTTNSFDVSNNRWICPSAGYYRINANLRLFGSNVLNNFYAVRIVINNTVRSEGLSTPFAGLRQDLICNDVFYLNAGDLVEIHVFGFGDNSSNAYFLEGGTIRTYVSIFKVQSPQTIAMGEVVAGYAKNTSGQSIPNSTDTVLTSWTVESDTHAIFNPSTGVLTVNRAGFIDMVFSVAFQQNGSGARSCHIYKNNTEFVGVDDRAPLSSWPVSAKAIVSAYPVKAGDTFVFRAWQNSGSSLNIDGSLNKTYITWRIY
jgi:hypothetical protein